jgi:hypothetical protein
MGAKHGEAVLLGELAAEVFDDDFVGTGLAGLVFDAIEFAGALANVGAVGDEFDAGVAILEPGKDDGGVKPAGVGEDDFLGRFGSDLWHVEAMVDPARRCVHPPRSGHRKGCVFRGVLCHFRATRTCTERPNGVYHRPVRSHPPQ